MNRNPEVESSIALTVQLARGNMSHGPLGAVGMLEDGQHQRTTAGKAMTYTTSADGRHKALLEVIKSVSILFQVRDDLIIFVG